MPRNYPGFNASDTMRGLRAYLVSTGLADLSSLGNARTRMFTTRAPLRTSGSASSDGHRLVQLGRCEGIVTQPRYWEEQFYLAGHGYWT